MNQQNRPDTKQPADQAPDNAKTHVPTPAEGNPETKNIEDEGDPIGANFA